MQSQSRQMSLQKAKVLSQNNFRFVAKVNNSVVTDIFSRVIILNLLRIHLSRYKYTVGDSR